MNVSLPKHINPDQDHAARAPYNFVPLPDRVVQAVASADELPSHDCYLDGHHTGFFTVTLRTKTPLYIRGGLSTAKSQGTDELSEFEQAEAEKSGQPPQDFRRAMKNKPDFFATINPNQPVIPGSSLRGMLRSLVEIITYSKVQWVTDKKLFFRTMDDSVVGESYRQRMMDNVESGFLQRDGDSYIIRTCTMVRVHHDKFNGISALFEGRAPNQWPKWRGSPRQHMPVWVTLKPGGNFVDEISLEKNSTPGWQEGRLVITGNMPGRKDGTGGKNKEFVFLLPARGAPEVRIPAEILERFHDDDQITQWQQKAFPKDTPRQNGRARSGLLITEPDEYEEPVFFLRESGELTFFGRAKMFRLPYQERPLDLIPPELRRPEEVDFAEAMFGFVRTRQELEEMRQRNLRVPQQGDKGFAYAGRVFVSDGHYHDAQGSPWLSDAPEGIIEPHILASPKPTSFQHYLTQGTPNNRKTLSHYDSNADAGESVTTLRGLKLYWAQGEKTAADLQAEPKDSRDEQRAFEKGTDGKPRVKGSSTQHTRMKPVAAGKTFTLQVYFENLTDIELGALHWALAVPDCHRLGMGKPLGMGVVKLENIEMHLTQRDSRYRRLFDNETWNTGENDKAPDDFITRFEAYMQTKVAIGSEKFRAIERIRMLLTMLTWREKEQQRDQRQYMSDLQDFRYRPVLPDPLNLGGVTRSRGRGYEAGGNPPVKQRREQHSSAQQRQQGQKPLPPQRPAQPMQRTEITLRDKTALPTQFVSQLQPGDFLRGKVLFVDEGEVFLEFPGLLNLSDKDVLGKVDAGMFDSNLPEEGDEVACVVVSVVEDDVEFTITCQTTQG
jgi:CRISPR-associated protein (TIGR03986 family)